MRSLYPECDLRNFPDIAWEHITWNMMMLTNTKDNPFNVIPGNRQDTRVEDGCL